MLGQQPKEGSGGSRIFFVHPDAADGVLVEFASKERAKDGEAAGENEAGEAR